MLELCPDARSADILVTAVQMRRRFERHLDWELAVSPCIIAYIIRLDKSRLERKSHRDASVANRLS
jgi:hypothetical protein